MAEDKVVRPHIVSTRLSDIGKAEFDRLRGDVKPGEYLRSLIVKASTDDHRKRGVRR